jgi:uncharacterized membrane protein YhaH (DUF805 family)
MWNQIKGWFDPALPVGSTGFTIVQVVGLILESILRRWIWAGDGAMRVLLLVGAMGMFAVMAIATAKRLLDVCRSRWWTVLITGLVLLDMLSAIHAKSSPVLRFAAILCVVLSVGYLALVAVLMFEKSAGGRGPRLKTKESIKLKSARSVPIGLANN